MINQQLDKPPTYNSQLIIVYFVRLCSKIEILCNAQAKSVSAKFLVGICNQDTTTGLDTNVDFCSRAYGNDGVIVGQHKMQGCQSNSPASAKADTEILKILFSEGESRSFGDCNLQRYGLDLFGFKNEPPRWKTKVLLHFAMEGTFSEEKCFSCTKSMTHKD